MADKKNPLSGQQLPRPVDLLGLLFITAALDRSRLTSLASPASPASPPSLSFSVMAFFFNRGRSRQPADVVRSTKDLLLRVQEAPNTPKVPSRESLGMHTSSLT